METQFSEMLDVISNGRQQLYERQQRARQTTPPAPASEPPSLNRRPAAAPSRPPALLRPPAGQLSYFLPTLQQRPPHRPPRKF